MHLDYLIVGCGYVGKRVASLALSQGHRVAALSHSVDSRQSRMEAGIEVIAGDLDRPEQLSRLRLADVGVYYFCPPTPGGIEDRRIGAFLAAIDGDALPARVVLISTTGVYGDCGGEWVDENRPLAPQANRSRCRVDVEARLRQWCETNAVALVILRVPGIYGPGRLPEARLRKGLPVLAEDESPWSNRIHVDDLAQACVKAMACGFDTVDGNYRVFNVSDGAPGTMSEYFFAVADHLGLPRPPQINRKEAELTLSAGMMSYLNESKRIDNRRMREELGVELAWPDLRAGLKAC